MIESPTCMRIRGELGDITGALPLVSVSIEAEITGLVATTRVRQVFRNVRSHPIEATYIFPLPDRAGVTAFRATLAGRVVEGVLREREQARSDYYAAIAAGRRASIAEEERAGVFTIRVGNLAAGETAEVELVLTGPLALNDTVAEYRFPLVVAPRYVAGDPLTGDQVGSGTALDTDAAPDATRVTPPVLLPGQASPVALALTARISGLPQLEPADVRSTLHAVQGEADQNGLSVQLLPGERLDRDVILRFPLGRETDSAVAILSRDDGDDTATWSVTIIPPAEGRRHSSRAVVLVLDRSGSMGGWKMVAARRAAARIIDALTAADRFAVLAFDNVIEGPTCFDGELDTMAAATDSNRWDAVQWLSRLEARGGTEMAQPLVRAARLLAASRAAARERFLVLVTDGQVAAEDSILRCMLDELGDSRVVCVGIDRAVNAAFLQRLALTGRGRCELVESDDRLDDVLINVHRLVSPPQATELQVSLHGAVLLPEDTVPQRAADLFPGSPCTITGRCSLDDSSHVLATIRGNGFEERQTPMTAVDTSALRSIWARARIRYLEDAYAGGPADLDRDKLSHEIVRLSLAHRVLSRFTAFVALDPSRTIEDPQASVPVIQPVEYPSGWALTAAASGPVRVVHPFGLRAGAATPEPATAAFLLRGRRLQVSEPEAATLRSPLFESLRVRLVAIIEKLESGDVRHDDRARLAGELHQIALKLHSSTTHPDLAEHINKLAIAIREEADLTALIAAIRRGLGAPNAQSRRRWWSTGRRGSSTPGPRRSADVATSSGSSFGTLQGPLLSRSPTRRSRTLPRK